MSDVVDLIEHDHRAVEQLFAKFAQTHDADLARQICDELDKHTKAEETRGVPGLRTGALNEAVKVHEAEDEHKEARQLIGRIRNTTEESHLVELMQQLEGAIQHHVQEEESEMLPKAREELPAEELSQLGDKFEEAKAFT